MSILKSAWLFIIAIALLIIFGLQIFFIQIFRLWYRNDDLGEWLYALAVSLDYLGATLLYGTVGHTISAIAYKKAIGGDYLHITMAYIINKLFQDDDHCKKAYTKEFNTK